MLKSLIKDPKKVIILFTILAGLLRLLFLDMYPPALYSDEVDQAYNAYSILKTGKDEHGTFLPISFRSFGDWKPPLQTYIMVPSVAIFGLTPLGVRLPGALLGTLTIPLLYVLIKEFFQTKVGERVALLSSLLLTISPWHIHHSRMAMLTVVALFFFMLGVYGLLKSFKKPFYLILAAIGFSLCIYSYYGMRLIVPLFGFFLIMFYRKQISWKSKEFFIALATGLFILTPLIYAFFTNPDVVLGRARTVSVFYDQGINLTLWERVTQEGQVNSKLVRFFHNKPNMYGLDIFRRWLSHFDGRFLFLSGDKHLPFQLPNMGILYLVDGVFLVIGMLYVWKEFKIKSLPLYIWMSVSILPAALTFLTPAANRSFNMVIPFMVFIAYGIIVILKKTSKKVATTLTGFIVLSYILNAGYFAYQYLHVLPRDHADWLLYGNKEIVEYINSVKDNYDEVVISGKLSVPYIYTLFFNKIDPQDFQKNAVFDNKPDNFGFEHVAAYRNYWFPRDFSWEKDSSKFADRTLLVTTAHEQVGDGADIEKIIYYPNKTEAYRIYSVVQDEK